MNTTKPICWCGKISLIKASEELNPVIVCRMALNWLIVKALCPCISSTLRKWMCSVCIIISNTLTQKSTVQHPQSGWNGSIMRADCSNSLPALEFAYLKRKCSGFASTMAPFSDEVSVFRMTIFFSILFFWEISVIKVKFNVINLKLVYTVSSRILRFSITER